MKPRPLILVGILASMVSGVGIGVLAYRGWFHADREAESYGRLFEQVLDEVQASYVGEVSREALLHGALRGMLRDLDPHSTYLDPAAWDDLQDETSGEFGGIGIEVGLVGDTLTVVSPIPGTPAEAAGLKIGDRILELDHEPLADIDLADAVHRLRGEPGTSLSLLIERADSGNREEIALLRALVTIDSVRHAMLEPGYGYIRINQFQVQTGAEFKNAVTTLIRDSGEPLRGLVLDLRNNPGGLLQSSVDVADALLGDGLIVYTEGKQRSSQLEFRAAEGDILDGAPVAVLINRGSASAAEVVAGALQDQGRAVLLGSRSYGKGSVQSVLQVSEHDAIKLTTAYYFTPRGRNIHNHGIEPDITLSDDVTDGLMGTDEQLLTEALDVLKGSKQGLHARL